MNNEFQNATIDGQKVTVYQLGKSSIEWGNGAGTLSDGMDTNKDNQPTRKLTDSAESIIIYFSRSGSTELLASKVERETNADILEVIVKDPYPSNYSKTLSRANFERENQDYPELYMQLPNLDQYKTIYLGYQIWAMTLSHPMTSFLNTYGNQLSNKRIAPFMSEGGYGQGDSVQVIKEILKQQGSTNNTFVPALIVDGNKVDRAGKQVNDWIKYI
ncbi:flavodoxin family protein [Companilactobacillus keshanensis]|uniref:Flavodoxin family protein n=1 Tax=Companilactobacillus keshanensis TaxID=2486003 RepID=A0ABW4BTF0_9LACO|nr:flavodoxin [Companilactobacillus keshanensis]